MFRLFSVVVESVQAGLVELAEPVEPQAVAGLAVQGAEVVASVAWRLPLPASAEAPETPLLQLASPDLQAAGLSVVWTINRSCLGIVLICSLNVRIL